MTRSFGALALVGLLAAPASALALGENRNPEDSTRSNGGVTPFTTAPLASQSHGAGAWSLEPQVALVEIAATVPSTDSTFKVRVPAAGVHAMYAFDERLAIFGSAYGSALFSGEFETPRLSGSMDVALGVGNLGLAVGLLGLERDAPLKLSAAVSVLGMVMRAKLTSGLSDARRLSEHPLFSLRGAAVAAAVQAEWRVVPYVSIVPYVAGWRLLAVGSNVGADDSRFDPPNRWHTSPGLDLWIYPVPEQPSHVSVGALVALTEDSPVTIVTIGYTFSG